MSSLARYRHGGGNESKEESIDLNPNFETIEAAAALESEIANMAGWFEPAEEEAGGGKGGKGLGGDMERKEGVYHRWAGSKVGKGRELSVCDKVDIDTTTFETCRSFDTHQSSQASNGASISQSTSFHSTPWTPHTPDISLSWGRDGDGEEDEGRGAGGAGGVGGARRAGVADEEGGWSLAGEEQLRKEAHEVVITDLVRRLADAEAGFRRVDAEAATMRRMHSLEMHRLQALIREGEAKIAQQQRQLTAAAANAAHTEVDNLNPKP